ncbi:hypothetical protein OI978_21390 [Serratia nevei]|uniref:hypothetical protein n=2 Tax=Serratia TaxID=613 RepID=UPI00254294B4|nr:hypothetical protein [Serratia nevei]WIJ63366.1 hypothetical protein OI978_21390 [Serratia nevei]
MIIGFGNNVVSSLAADITATQTTIKVMPGAGALFARLLTYDYANDSNPLKVYAKITLTDAKETVFEVCHLTAVNNDMLTVVRGQEGTAAKGWSLNDVIANFATRGSENQFVQIEQLQSGHYTSAVAGGTANGLTLALPATFFLNGSTEWALKTPILIYPTLNNTGASTLQLTMGGRVMGTYPLVKGSNTALRAGDIIAKNPFLAVFNTDQGRFIVLNPTTNVGAVMTVNSHAPDAAGNVKLGTAADADIGTGRGNVMAVGAFGLGGGGFEFNYANNADLMAALRANGSCFFRNNRDGTGLSSWSPSVYYRAGDANGVLSINPFTGIVAAMGFTDANTTAPKVNTLYGTANKPTTSDINAVNKAGDTMTGQLIAPSVATTPEAMPNGAGAFVDQLSSQAPFFQPNWQWPVNSGGIFVPIAKGVSTRKGQGYPTAISFGYLMPNDAEHAHPTIHAKGDSNVDCVWDFNPYTGNISSKAGTFATQQWVNDGLGGRVDWGTFNREVGARATTDYVNGNFVQNVRLSGRINRPDTGGQIRVPDGCVFTGMSGANYDPSIWASYSYVQVFINGSWRNIGTS